MAIDGRLIDLQLLKYIMHVSHYFSTPTSILIPPYAHCDCCSFIGLAEVAPFRRRQT